MYSSDSLRGRRNLVFLWSGK